MENVIRELTERSGAMVTVIPKFTDKAYKVDTDQKAVIDRMKCGKLCIYHQPSFNPKGGFSYRVYKNDDDLFVDFDMKEIHFKPKKEDEDSK